MKAKFTIWIALLVFATFWTSSSTEAKSFKKVVGHKADKKGKKDSEAEAEAVVAGENNNGGGKSAAAKSGGRRGAAENTNNEDYKYAKTWVKTVFIHVIKVTIFVILCVLIEREGEHAF